MSLLLKTVLCPATCTKTTFHFSLNTKNRSIMMLSVIWLKYFQKFGYFTYTHKLNSLKGETSVTITLLFINVCTNWHCFPYFLKVLPFMVPIGLPYFTWQIRYWEILYRAIYLHLMLTDYHAGVLPVSKTNWLTNPSIIFLQLSLYSAINLYFL